MADPRITITAVDQTKAAFASIAGQFDGLRSKAIGLKTAFAGVVAGLATSTLAINFKSAIDAADKLDELSQKIGVSVESLSTLRFAAAQSGTDIESLGEGLKKLTVNMSSAQKGTDGIADAFKVLGVSVESTPGVLRNVEDVLGDIADRFASTADGANKTALAVALFGRSGNQLIPFLNNGRAGLAALQREAERLGISLSSATASQANQLNDNLDALGEAAKATARSLANSLIPALTDITTRMRLAAEQGGLLKGILEGLRSAFALATFERTAGQQVEFINQKLRDQLLLIQRLETQQQRRGTLPRDRRQALAAAKEELERLKDESLKAQELLKFSTPGGLNPNPPPKPQAPGLPNRGAEDAARKKEEQRIKALREFEKLAQSENDKRIEAGFQASEKEAAAAQKTTDENKQLAQSFIDLADPTAKFVRQLEQIRALAKDGFLTADQVAGAEFAIQNQIEELQSLGNEIDKTKSIADELGLTFSSAFEDAISGGKKLSEILRGLEQDILRIVTRKLVTEPLAEKITGAIKGSDFGSAIGEFFKGIFGGGRALGGPVLAGVPYVVGERGPELFVPEARGRIVSNQQGRTPLGNVNITINMPQGASRETALQAAARVGQAVQVAMRRNG